MSDIFKPTQSKLERAERELQRVENQIIEEASDILQDALEFGRFDPESKELPAEFIEQIVRGELTPERAERKARVARAAWASAKHAPVGLMLAKSVVIGAMKARAQAGNAPKHLNVTLVSITAPTPEFPEKEIKHE